MRSGEGGYFSDDTIIAVATSLSGDAGVGIIRLSGNKSLAVAQKFCDGFDSPNPRFLYRISVKDNEEILDDGLAVYFPQGASFTGEEVVELQLHGGRALLQSVLQLLISSGMCRIAKPGEFSFRAIQNGRMTVDQAQAVQQLVVAKSKYELWSARQNISKARAAEFDSLLEKIRHLLSLVELSIDFIDQDVEVISKESAYSSLSSISSEVEQLYQKLILSRRIARGIYIVLVGDPNAGKSTLFNQILAEDRSIVSSEAGTTRDLVTEEFLLGPYRVRLADTAGLRVSNHVIEKEGIERTKTSIEEADLVLLVLDGELALEFQKKGKLEEFFAARQNGKARIVVLNKAESLEISNVGGLLLEMLLPHQKLILTSAMGGRGIDMLLEGLKVALDDELGIGITSPLPTELQFEMVVKCNEAIKASVQLLHDNGLQFPELLSESLKIAAQALSDVSGATTPDTILEKIFKDFCIGK